MDLEEIEDRIDQIKKWQDILESRIELLEEELL